jgi:hypothetical protein
MLVLETAVFVLFLGGVCSWGLLREYFVAKQKRRRAQDISRLVESLAGHSIGDAKRQFGPPIEEIIGDSGRSLHIWRAPPAGSFPEVPGVLIVTLTADENGVVTDTAWRRW